VLYAPTASEAWLHLADHQAERALTKQDDGYFTLTADDLPPGTRYLLRTNKMRTPRPDPASRYQPDGVHAASAIVDDALFTEDRFAWPGRPLSEMVLYELHIGTFTKEGTLEAAIEWLHLLVKLGVNTVELMPLNQFPGARNWGYDGVYWQAVQNSYGGPEQLVQFIDAAHELDLAVIIDAVYNHLGPEGNYLPKFGPYLTEKHHTPWGPAVNLDDAGADGVRDLILASAKTWLVDYGADGLRLDAVHALRDSSATHILEAMSSAAKTWSAEVRRPLTLIGECDLNDPSYITPAREGGLGLHGQWTDEFHHALRTHMTGETRGYYADFGSRDALIQSLRSGYNYVGQYSEHRKRRFGKMPTGRELHQFVVFGQNHDQIGNRAIGDRLNHHLSEAEYLLQAATVIWSPFTPMLWMGEEYAETNPFPYFVDHGDPAILAATRKGRMREFAPFVEEGQEVPDPGLKRTFTSAKLTHKRKGKVYNFYREALAVRRQYWPLRERNLGTHDVEELHGGLIGWRMPLTDGRRIIVLANFGDDDAALSSLSPGWDVLASRLRAYTNKPSDVLAAKAAAVWLTA